MISIPTITRCSYLHGPYIYTTSCKYKNNEIIKRCSRFIFIHFLSLYIITVSTRATLSAPCS